MYCMYCTSKQVLRCQCSNDRGNDRNFHDSNVIMKMMISDDDENDTNNNYIWNDEDDDK